MGGRPGAMAGSLALGTAGTLGGAWAAHGAYREGQLIGNILSHPENWTVDAAGAIVPTPPAQNLSSDTDESNGADLKYLQSGVGTVGSNDSESPVRFLGSRYQHPLGSGMTDWQSPVHSSDPLHSAQPAPSPQQPGGLLGLVLDHLRDNPNN